MKKIELLKDRAVSHAEKSYFRSLFDTPLEENTAQHSSVLTFFNAMWCQPYAHFHPLMIEYKPDRDIPAVQDLCYVMRRIAACNDDYDTGVSRWLQYEVSVMKKVSKANGADSSLLNMSSVDAVRAWLHPVLSFALGQCDPCALRTVFTPALYSYDPGSMPLID